MTKASISKAKDQLSALIKRVQSGDPVVITDRGIPVAELVPVRLGAGLPPRVVALAQEGIVRLPDAAPDASWLDRPRPHPTAGPSPVEMLLEDRRLGR
ncbi:MAG: type II toxin-antitoxin system Phd/YefM family antitoxin [Gemmatimonadales bacterium]